MPHASGDIRDQKSHHSRHDNHREGGHSRSKTREYPELLLSPVWPESKAGALTTEGTLGGSDTPPIQVRAQTCLLNIHATCSFSI